jgi:uncharacterized membrane protein YhhN
MYHVRSLSALFSILLLIELYGELSLNELLIWIAKPLLMPALLILFTLNCHRNPLIERICVMIALMSSCLGDVLLLFKTTDSFLVGLIAFLIAHISYIISFVARLRHEGDELRRRLTVSGMIISSVPFIAYCAYMLSIFCPVLYADREQRRKLLIPLVIYTLIIISMAYVSYLRDRKMNGFWPIFAGTIFFVVSDSILAFNKFIIDLPASGLSIMCTYGLAQYLITIGTLQVTSKDMKAA